MKRLSSSDSVAGLISLCPTTSTDEESRRRYGREYKSILERDEEEEGEEEEEEEMIVVGRELHQSEKKRRLSNNQVKALEKNFEIENKLEPERKVKLAEELGLQPRQVAVWFQNRRARWKTKQLEKDYSSLKTQFDSLRHNFDSLRRHNDSLLQEISKLKSKLNGGEEDQNNNNLTPQSEISIKEELISNQNQNQNSTEPSSPPQLLEHSGGFNYRTITELLPISTTLAAATTVAAAVAGSSDSSESSAVLNEIPGRGIFQFVKTENSEDHEDFLSGEEACGFFSDEQPPSLHWYSAVDHWT